MTEMKRQVLPPPPAGTKGLWPGLWVVATPLGNLSDLSERGRMALGGASFIACEDTRRTGELLAALGIKGIRLERLDAHASPREVEAVAARISEAQAIGLGVALVTDAGTPGVSDPGAALVEAARKHGVRVTPVPGPSAVATLASISGFTRSDEFVFHGFFPRKKGQIEDLFETLKAERIACAHYWYESPQRIGETLAECAKGLGDDWAAVAGKELTKLHERVFWGMLPELSRQVAAELTAQGARGEWCFGIETVSARGRKVKDPLDSSEWVKTLTCLLRAEVSVSRAAAEVSQAYDVSRKEVYARALSLLTELKGPVD